MAALPQPVAPLDDAERKKITAPDEQWADDFALKIVNSDFREAEGFKQNFHDSRLHNADELFKAWCVQKTWPGTKQPRSSLGIYLCLQQIEALLPNLMGALFGDELFEVDPKPGYPKDWAEACEVLEREQLHKARFEKVCHLALKSAAIYGNGVFEMYWKHEEVPKWQPRIAIQPIMRQVQDITGAVQDIMVGRRRVMEMHRKMERISEPRFRNHSIFDVYPDPNCPTPVIQDGRYFAIRKFVTIGELERLKDTPGFKVPPRALLLELAKSKPVVMGDTQKQLNAATRGEHWEPQRDYTSDPSLMRIELIEYTTPERKIQTLNRLWTLYNRPNPYGFINFYDFWYCDVLDRWFSIGVCDLLESEQRLQMAITNGRIDEVALGLHPATIKRRGINIPQSQMTRRPGGVLEVPNSTDDIKREEVTNITQSAYLEVGASETRAQKYTGITDFAGLGVSPTQGNAGARTATGSSIMATAQASRLNYMVRIAEYAVIEPMLSDLHMMNRLFLDPEEPLFTRDGRQIDPMLIKSADVEYCIRASVRMQSRQFLLQNFPLIAQTFLNPAYMEMLARVNGMKVNVAEIGRALQDMTGYRQRWGDFFVPMTPEEMQALNQPKPEDQMRLQMQRERIAGQAAIAEEKSSADLMHMITEKTADAIMASGEDEGTAEGAEGAGSSAGE